MKNNIHPKYDTEATFTCSTCGTVYEIGSIHAKTTVAICAKCHPFYTGDQQVMLDTANKIGSYKEKLEKASLLKKRREEIEKQKIEREKSKVRVIGSTSEQRLTLRDLLKTNSK